MEKQFKKGFVLGKFMPPHKGHEYMCRFASNLVDELTILVCSLESEPIKGELRRKWMSEMFPNARVVLCREELPQYPEEHPYFWNIWNDVVKRYAGNDIDVIVASEPYGETLAKNYGCKFMLCDIDRETFPCSGTQVRENPDANWKYLPDVVRSHYAFRVCMIGVESTGKTTLAKDLVRKLSETTTVGYVPEYGRLYTEFHGSDVGPDDMVNIVNGHLASRKAIEKMGFRWIVEDTDFVMSAVWSDILTSQRDKIFDELDEYADLYILCDIDLPWVDDGTRYFSDDADRKVFHEKVLKELKDRHLPFRIAKGQGSSRLESIWRIFQRIDLL